MTEVKATREFNRATQKKCARLLHILEAIQVKNMSSTDFLGDLDCSPSAVRATLNILLAEGLIIDTEPHPRKGIYRISPDKKKVYDKLKALRAKVSVELVEAPRVIRKKKVDPIPSLKYKHSELHMLLFSSVYKNFISS